MLNKNFYPTPKHLINRMYKKISWKDVKTVLEPSAGKGNIVEFIKEKARYGRNIDISCIEIDTDLQATLKGKNFKVIDSDFLTYSGLDKFDVIIANPPFDQGDQHLLQAINILYSGQIVFLLNAETLRNPYTATRQILKATLDELKADIQYIQGAFKSAERKTGVEIALVYIHIERNIELDLFAGCNDTISDFKLGDREDKDIASGNSIEFLVESFDATVKSCLEMIEHFYKNSLKIGSFLSIKVDDENSYSSDSTKEQIHTKINQVLTNIRKYYWRKVLELKEVKNRMTAKIRSEFDKQIRQQSFMDFTASNIRSFIINLIGSYEDILTQAVAEIFDRMSEKHHWYDETSTNVHYFNGWKTNKAHYVNTKVILPIYGVYASPYRFKSDEKEWCPDWDVKKKLDDIDIVMNYFSSKNEYVSIVEAITRDFSDQTRNILSTFFKISIFKKGTIHLTFLDENIRRRFNVCACKHKNWLWKDYGVKEYGQLTQEEKDVVESFEGKKSYIQNMGQIGFAKQDLNLLEQL